MDTLLVAFALGLAGVVLYFNLWRAVLFLRPQSIEVEADAPADKMQLPPELAKLGREVCSLGFRPIGSRCEKPRFTCATTSYDYAHEGAKVFATIYRGRDGSPRLYFLSQTAEGALVISANYRRPARELPLRYFSSSLEGFPSERVYRAHLRRVASFGSPVGRFDQEGRLEVARAWFSGPGKTEVRLQNLHGLLWSLGTLGLLAAALFGR